MLHDTRAAHTVVSEKIWKTIVKPELKKTNNLIAYTNSEIPTSVNVEAFDRKLICPLYLSESDDISLFGLNWNQAFQLELPPGSTLPSLD
ncbi:hypothetical protein JTB14_033000 [Gonioctena quinquepunctata]|nr:hypothetical protein JTB14_033000 [Gonioctena quinquepunctata]